MQILIWGTKKNAIFSLCIQLTWRKIRECNSLEFPTFAEVRKKRSGAKSDWFFFILHCFYVRRSHQRSLQLPIDQRHRKPRAGARRKPPYLAGASAVDLQVLRWRRSLPPWRWRLLRHQNSIQRLMLSLIVRVWERDIEIEIDFAEKERERTHATSSTIWILNGPSIIIGHWHPHIAVKTL